MLDDVQVLTEFNREDEPKLSYHLKGGVFQGKIHPSPKVVQILHKSIFRGGPNQADYREKETLHLAARDQSFRGAARIGPAGFRLQLPPTTRSHATAAVHEANYIQIHQRFLTILPSNTISLQAKIVRQQ